MIEGNEIVTGKKPALLMLIFFAVFPFLFFLQVFTMMSTSSRFVEGLGIKEGQYLEYHVIVGCKKLILR